MHLFSLPHSTRSLRWLGLVGILFYSYVIYLQWQISRVERQLRQQISQMDKMGARTNEVYQLAVLDPLTGLYNRRFGEQRLTEEILRAERHGRPLGVVLFDLDGLKQINDTFGHSAGDQLIQCFAERLQSAVRGSDFAVRLGGDEFLVLLPECTPREIQHVLERVAGASVNLGGRLVPVAFSAGWSDYTPGDQPGRLLQRADELLYSNKRVGKERAQKTLR